MSTSSTNDPPAAIPTHAPAKVASVELGRLVGHTLTVATATVEAPTMSERLEAAQELLEQAYAVRLRLVLEATTAERMPLSQIGRALNMSPQGARKIVLAARARFNR